MTARKSLPGAASGPSTFSVLTGLIAGCVASLASSAAELSAAFSSPAHTTRYSPDVGCPVWTRWLVAVTTVPSLPVTDEAVTATGGCAWPDVGFTTATRAMSAAIDATTGSAPALNLCKETAPSLIVDKSDEQSRQSGHSPVLSTRGKTERRTSPAAPRAPRGAPHRRRVAVVAGSGAVPVGVPRPRSTQLPARWSL